jgi:hypothetical protein
VADGRAVAERILQLREASWTLQAIADLLNEEQVPTGHGAPQWRVSSVQAAATIGDRARGSPIPNCRYSGGIANKAAATPGDRLRS